MLLNNKYEFNPQTDLLGKGGFGKVYKAKDIVLNYNVALKLADKNDLPEKYSLVAEIARVLDLHHENLVKYRDAFIHKATDTLGQETDIQVGVMEYINSGDLKQFCGKTNAIPELNKLLIGILEGLGYLHSKGIIHRDIKPQNILLQKENSSFIPKISDFGISKNIGDAGSTVSGIIGSQAYMSPEQLNNSTGKLSSATDLWSFGVMLYELFTGERPFDEPGVTSETQIITNIVKASLPDKVNSIAEPYQSIIKSCVFKDLNKRLKTSNEVIELLNNPVNSEKTILKPTNEKTDVISNETQTHSTFKDEEKTELIENIANHKETSEKSNAKRTKKKKPTGWIVGVFVLIIIGIISISSVQKKKEEQRLKDEQYLSYIEQGEDYMESENYEAAIAEFENSRSIYPQKEEPGNYILEAKKLQKEKDDAEKARLAEEERARKEKERLAEIEKQRRERAKVPVIYYKGKKLYISPVTNAIKVDWSPNETKTYVTSSVNGKLNTAQLVSIYGRGEYAASVCYELDAYGYDDWYLPSKDELKELFLNKDKIGGWQLEYYWSSTEEDNDQAWSRYFKSGHSYDGFKYLGANVRCVRKD